MRQAVISPRGWPVSPPAWSPASPVRNATAASRDSDAPISAVAWRSPAAEGPSRAEAPPTACRCTPRRRRRRDPTCSAVAPFEVSQATSVVVPSTSSSTSSYASGSSGVRDRERAAAAGSRQGHDQGPDHRVDLLGVLVRGEELARPVHQQRVELRLEPSAGQQAEAGPQPVEHRPERPVPSPSIDLDPALGDLPRVPDAPVEQGRLAALAVPRRPSEPAELARLRLIDGQAKLAHPSNLDAQGIGRRRPVRAVPPVALHLAQEGADPVACVIATASHLPELIIALFLLPLPAVPRRAPAQGALHGRPVGLPARAARSPPRRHLRTVGHHQGSADRLIGLAPQARTPSTSDPAPASRPTDRRPRHGRPTSIFSILFGRQASDLGRPTLRHDRDEAATAPAAVCQRVLSGNPRIVRYCKRRGKERACRGSSVC